MTDERLIHVSGLQFPEPVGKRLDRLADGSLEKTQLLDPRAGPSAVINEAFATAKEAFDYRLKADCKTMFFTGTYAAEVPSGALAVPQDALTKARDVFEPSDWLTIVGFTKDYLAFRPGAGLLPIDIDTKDADEVEVLWPEAPVRLETVDDVSVAIDAILPEAHGCPILIMPSSGSMIVEADTGKLVKGPGGWRVVIAVDDAGEIPRILETIHLRCWAREEFRYAFLAKKSAAFLPRSLADEALGRPTQPDYVMPELGRGLVKAAGVAEMFDDEGPLLVASLVVLAPGERALAEKNIEAARVALAPAATKLRGKAIRNHADELVRRGVPKAAAEKAAAQRFEAGVFAGSDLIWLDDDHTIPAALLLTAEGEAYDGRLCRDPVEPDYDGDRCVAKIYWNDGMRPGINSFAHGRKFWKIAHDAETVAAAIDDAEATADSMTLALAQAELEPVERSQLVKRAAKALGLGNERQSLKDGVKRQKQRITAHAREHAAPDDEEGTRARAETVALGHLLASIGLPPQASPKEVLEQHFKIFAYDQEEKTIVKLDGSGYTAKPHEHHDIWAPCGSGDDEGFVSRAWMVNINRRITVEGSRVRPDMPSGLYTEGGKTWRNLYRPPEHPAEGGDVAVFVEMLEWMFPETVEREWFADWLAHKRGKPHVRGTAAVMVAVTRNDEQSFGAGRGTLFKIIEKLFGSAYVRPVGFTELQGRGSQGAYNDYLEALIVVVEEAASNADDTRYHERRAAFEHLKTIIDTSPAKVRIKSKYGRIRDIITYASFLIASNHSNPLAIPPGERRLTVLKNGPPLPDDLLERINSWAADPNNIGALARWLDARDLANFNPYKPLETATKARMTARGLSAIDHLLKEAREAKGAFPGKAFIVPQLQTWLDVNAADDRELAGVVAWDSHFNAALKQHCRRVMRTEAEPHRIRIGKSRRYAVHCWAGDEDEMTALGAEDRDLLVDEVVKNNQASGDYLHGIAGLGSTVVKEDNLSAEVVDMEAAKKAKEATKPR